MTPVVSVVVPAYNQGRFIRDALTSVEGQALREWECIVVDDGSEDDTASIVDSYVRRDGRFRIVRQANRGAAAARNAGLDAATGKYIQFLDADDLIGRDKLARQVQALDQLSGPRVSYTFYRYCPEDDPTATASRDSFGPPRFLKERPLYDLVERWETQFSIPCHCFLFDASFFAEDGIRFDEHLPNHEDWDCWVRIFSRDPAVHACEEVYAIYRLHAASMCADAGLMHKGFIKALDKQRSAFKRDKVVRRLLDRKRAEVKRLYRDAHGAGSRRPNPVELARMSWRRHVPWPIQKWFQRMARSRRAG